MAFNMEFFINETSFEGQYHEDLHAQNALKQLVELTDIIIAQIKEGAILKSNLLLYTSLKFREILISTLEHFPKELKSIIIRRIYDSTLIADWNNSMQQNVQIEYFCETVKKVVTNSSLAEAAERKIQDQLERYLINLNPSSYSSISQTTILKKATSTVSSTLFCISSHADLKKFFHLERIYPDDYLRNDENFIKTKFDVQGRIVYKKIDNGEFWYLDNLHKNHFEVFTSKLIHVGEANLDGELIAKTRDKNKDNTLVF